MNKLIKLLQENDLFAWTFAIGGIILMIVIYFI